MLKIEIEHLSQKKNVEQLFEARCMYKNFNGQSALH